MSTTATEEPRAVPDATETAWTAAVPDESSHRRDTIVTTVTGLAVYALSLLTSPLLARALGADGRGSLAAVLRPTELIGWLLMLGVPAATAYLTVDADRRSLQATSWVVGLCAGVPVVAVLWPLVPHFLAKHPPETVAWFRWSLVASLLVLPFQNVYEYLRVAGATWRFNYYRSLPTLISTVLVVGFYVDGSLTLVRALAVHVAANVAVPILVVVSERGVIVRFDRWFDRALARRQMAYGMRVWFGTLSNMVLARFDQLLMVRLVSPGELGLYAVAATGAMIIAPLAQGVGFTLFPFLRRELDPERRRAKTNAALAAVGWGSLLAALALAALAPFGLPLLMGKEFGAAIIAFLLLVPGQVCWNIAQVYKVVLEAGDRPGAASWALGVAAIFTVVAVPLAVSVAGIEGAATVTTLSQALFLVVVRWQARPVLTPTLEETA